MVLWGGGVQQGEPCIRSHRCLLMVGKRWESDVNSWAPFLCRRGVSSTDHEFFCLSSSHHLLPLIPSQFAFAPTWGACYSTSYHIHTFLVSTSQHHPKSTALPFQTPSWCLQSHPPHLMDPNSPIQLPPPGCILCPYWAPVSPSQLSLCWRQSQFFAQPAQVSAPLVSCPSLPKTYFLYSFRSLLFYFSSLLLPLLYFLCSFYSFASDAENAPCGATCDLKMQFFGWVSFLPDHWRGSARGQVRAANIAHSRGHATTCPGWLWHKRQSQSGQRMDWF